MAGSDELALTAGHRAVVDHEIHGNRRLGDLLEGNGSRILRRADRISDVQVIDAGQGDDIADGRLVDLDPL